MLGDIGLCDTEAKSCEKAGVLIYQLIVRSSVCLLDNMLAESWRPEQMAKDVLDLVGRKRSTRDIVGIVRAPRNFMLHATRGFFEVTTADQGAQRLALQCVVMGCGDSPSP
jgi:hypothetical protein